MFVRSLLKPKQRLNKYKGLSVDPDDCCALGDDTSFQPSVTVQHAFESPALALPSASCTSPQGNQSYHQIAATPDESVAHLFTAIYKMNT